MNLVGRMKIIGGTVVSSLSLSCFNPCLRPISCLYCIFKAQYKCQDIIYYY